MTSPGRDRILSLLQEVVELVGEDRNLPGTSAFSIPSSSSVIQPRNVPTNSPTSVLAELRNRFAPYPSVSPQRFRVAGRSAGRRLNFAPARLWSNKFFCLSGPMVVKTPTAAERLTLALSDLGEKVVQAESDAPSNQLKLKIVEMYPKLTGIEFELMRCVGTGGYGKPIARVSSTEAIPNVNYLKVSRISTIFIRPSVEMTLDDEDQICTPNVSAADNLNNNRQDLNRTSICSIAGADPDNCSQEEELPTMASFQANAQRLNPGVELIRIVRENYLERLVGVYKNPDLNLEKELKVEFFGEAGTDYGALKREYFWKGFVGLMAEKLYGRALFEGEKDHLVPAADSTLLRAGIFRFLGKFMAHAAIQCGIGFLGLSEAVAEYLTTDNVTSDTPFSITLEDIPDPDNKITILNMRKLQSGATLTHEEASDVQQLALNSDFLDTVTTGNVDEAVVQVLYNQVIERRKPYLDSMKEAFSSTGLLKFMDKHSYVRSGVFPRMKDVRYPLRVVLDRVQYKGNQIVVDYVKEYLSELTEDKIPALLKAWTGWSIIPETPLKITVEKDVEFNASTCFEEIFVPEDFQKDDVKTWFDLLIDNPEGFGSV